MANHTRERKKHYALPCGRCPDEIICDVRDCECVCDCGAAIDDRFCFFDSLDLSLPLSGAESVTLTFGSEPLPPGSGPPRRLDDGSVRLLVTPIAPPIGKPVDVGLSPPDVISPSSRAPYMTASKVCNQRMSPINSDHIPPRSSVVRRRIILIRSCSRWISLSDIGTSGFIHPASSSGTPCL